MTLHQLARDDVLWEVETTAETTVRERWRVVAPADSTPEDLLDLLGHDSASFIDETNIGEEQDRTVVGSRIVRSEPHARPVGAPVNPVGLHHPATAQAAGRRMALRLGSKRQKVYEWIKARGLRGATADEVGEHFGWGHQSASAAVSTLKKDGWLVVRRYDGHPVTRPTRSGNPAEVMITREDTNDR